ncbi:recombinase family protein [Actinoplanes oblitus]|uniref:Recombinase family protein n=1 Tax=Actinoplanes oblitus TaxID=3040509 RepID=A0ABY8WV25_9ACTN|nr:recombinase family protein [Actinoplanes oblitus]WIN00881.1 recombinase family protein [Actinoplanes oblitus]
MPPTLAKPQVIPSGPKVTAIYLRLSRKSKRSVSLEVQEQECRALIERMNWPEAIVIFADKKSASDRSKTREGYDLLLAWCKAGRVARIVSRDDDRLVRQPLELEGLIDHLEPHAVPVYFYVSGYLDLASSPGRANARIRGAIARQEVERKSERQKENNLFRVKHGEPIGGPSPTGLQYVKRDGDSPATYRHEPNGADAIRWAHDFVMRGGTVTDVCREWERRGITTKTGKPHTWRSAKNALCNPAIAGYLAYQPSSILSDTNRPGGERWVSHRHKLELTKGNWEPVISSDDWHAMVAVLTNTRQQPGNNLKWLLSGQALCGVCAGSEKIVCRNYSDGRQARMYICKKGRHIDIPAEPIDDYIISIAVEIVRSRDFHDQGKEEIDLARRELLLTRKHDLEGELEALTRSYTQRKIKLPQLVSGSESLNAQLDRVVQELEGGIEAHPAANYSEGFSRQDFQALSLEQKRLLVADVLPEIRIFPPLRERGGPYPPVASYVHAYDRRGRLRPLPTDQDIYDQVTVKQYEHAARYGRPVLIDGEPATGEAVPSTSQRETLAE